MDSYKRKLFLENGLIVKEIHKRDYYSHSYDPDTIIYHYNKHRQIDQTTSLKSVTREYANYKYDDKGNLNLIASEIYAVDYIGNVQIAAYDSAWFQDYDNSPNLVKDLIIFQECFYRALSTNNFRKYARKRYSSTDSVLFSIDERSWKFAYDGNNNLIY
jgi:hypothetical protein